MKGINIFLADGFEDIEALATGDVLKRAGFSPRYISVTGSLTIRSSHGVHIVADGLLSSASTDGKVSRQDIMIFPGGMPGSKTLSECRDLIREMNRHYREGGSLAAICAAPGLVLSQLEGAGKERFTCFDSFEKYLEPKGWVFEKAPAVRSGRIVTGRSAGHAIAFGLEIVSMLDPSKAEEVRRALFLDTI